MNHIINSQLICPDYTKEYPKIKRGEGMYLFDHQDQPYMDLSGCTAAASNIGHGNQKVSQALLKQTQEMSIIPTHLFYNDVVENYLQTLCEFLPEGFEHAWTVSGGTEAVENAIKLAFQYHRSKGRNRNKVLARWGSYHGNSLFMLDVGGMVPRRAYYEEVMADQLHVSPCFPYRKTEGLSLEEYEDALVEEFAKMIEKEGENIMAFVAEPIVGAALGAVSPTEGYYRRIKLILAEKDILFIADEVMTGFGRTGKRFGMQHFGENADIIAMAKGISAGYFPLGAIAASNSVFQTVRDSNQPFFSGQTYSCIPQAAAVGQAVLDVIQNENLVENSKKVGVYLKQKLEDLYDFDFVGDVRGEGLFVAVEFVEDKKSKQCFAPEKMVAKTIEQLALEEGVVTYACRGTVDYTKGDHMLFSPPLIMTESQVDEAVEKFTKALIRFEGLQD